MKYNGHKNWNHWNVSLWINNDEGLYNLARRCVWTKPNRTAAARMFLECMDGISKTPDGAPYSLSAVRSAMVEMQSSAWGKQYKTQQLVSESKLNAMAEEK